MAKKNAVSAAVICHKGCERDNNEDNFFFNGDIMPLGEMDKGANIRQEFGKYPQVYAVCDGMGGGMLGERASYIAARQALSLLENFKPNQASASIEKYAVAASDAVHADAKKSNSRIEGTTLALLVLYRRTAYVANVGDSRVYRLRAGEIELLSHDHSEVNRMRAAGLLTAEEARKSSRGNVITQYIGVSPSDRTENFVYQSKHTLTPGDRFLICSDGVSDLIANARIKELMTGAETPSDAAKALIRCALEMGGKDNATAIVLDV